MHPLFQNISTYFHHLWISWLSFDNSYPWPTPPPKNYHDIGKSPFFELHSCFFFPMRSRVHPSRLIHPPTCLCITHRKPYKQRCPDRLCSSPACPVVRRYGSSFRLLVFLLPNGISKKIYIVGLEIPDSCKLVLFPGIKYLSMIWYKKKHSVINRPCNFLIFLFCFLFARPAAANMPTPAPVGESTAKIKVNVVDNFIIHQSFKSDKKNNNNDRHWYTSILTIAQY